MTTQYPLSAFSHSGTLPRAALERLFIALKGLATMAGDWLKLHRKITRSAVFEDEGLLKLWIYLLANANWDEKQLLNGVVLKPGQLVIGQERLAVELKTTRQQLRTRLKTLEKLGNLTIQSTSHGTHVSICNWATYQSRDIANQPAEQPTLNQQLTNDQPTVNQRLTIEEEGKNLKKERTKEEKGAVARSVFVIPSVEEIRQYCQERSNQVDPDQFSDYYAARGWELSKGRKMKDWRAAVRTWEKNGYTTSNGKPKKTEKQTDAEWEAAFARKLPEDEQ